MGHFIPELPEYLIEWILKQQMFWVATSPLSEDGHVNISPKGIQGTFHVVNSRRVWYEDLSGTGAETVAHIRENGRITILFHAFEGPARIVRLYGKGFFHEIGSPEYEALLPPNKRIAGSRAIIGLDIFKVATTCGYAVPYYNFVGHRSQLVDWAAKKELADIDDAASSLSSPTNSGIEQTSQDPTSIPSYDIKGMKYWWVTRNLQSIDGLPAFSANIGRKFKFAVSFPFGRSYQKATAQAPIPNVTYSSSALPAKAAHSSPTKDPIAIDYDFMRTQQLYQSLHTWLITILPFLFIFILGILLGRCYDQYLSTSSPMNFTSHRAERSVASALVSKSMR